jgi:integrase
MYSEPPGPCIGPRPGTAPGGWSAGSRAAPGITKPVGPHTLRHALITAALDAGVSHRDVQKAASHADPRTAMRYVAPVAAWTNTPPISPPHMSPEPPGKAPKL